MIVKSILVGVVVLTIWTIMHKILLVRRQVRESRAEVYRMATEEYRIARRDEAENTVRNAERVKW